MGDDGLAYVAVGLLAALVAGGELANRFTDRPSAALREPAALMYLLINAGGSVAALYVIRVFGWDFGVEGDDAVGLMQVAVAGLGALALFRLKLFAPALSQETISLAPARVLERLLAVADREVDRRQALDRAALIEVVSSGLSFDKSFKALPAMALTLLETVDEESQERLGEDVRALVDDDEMHDRQKVFLLVGAVLRVTGPDLLRTATRALGGTTGE